VKPFVTEVEKKHEWRVVDNEKLAFSNAIFEKFQQITQIQRAFFPNGDNKLYVPFTLQPVSLDKSMKGFTLNINGQELNYQKNMSRILSWPGNHNLHASTFNFVAPNDQLVSNTANGDWGWFRLVTQATNIVRTRKEIALNFEVDGHAASYILFTQGPVNPFLPLNLTKFSLSEKL
jgi:type VI protein secretion system component VasK